MATKKTARKPMGKKAMKKTKGGGGTDFMKIGGNNVESRSLPMEQLSMNYNKITY